mmetsp:Transcript_84511/g.103571  ORF Transcript_84511/g.103571 Transcript_84511/m.103571 type:complete len:316 (+) Transcript_84511:42-989(+)
MVPPTVENVGILSCCIIGILGIIVIAIWIHGLCMLRHKSDTKSHHFLYYLTLFTIIGYSSHVILSIVSTVLYLIGLKYVNIIDIQFVHILAFPIYAVWVGSIYMMFALFVLRLDLTFRNTFLQYNRRTIKLLWIIYGALVVFVPVSVIIYILELSLVLSVLGSIGTITFISFAIALFKMFVKKLRQVANEKDQKGPQYIKDLVIKLSIIIVISISSTFLTFVCTTVIGTVYTGQYPHEVYFVSHILIAGDSCTNAVLIYLSMAQNENAFKKLCKWVYHCVGSSHFVSVTNKSITHIDLESPRNIDSSDGVNTTTN